MDLDEKLRLPDLLAPIPGEDPVGPDLKYSNEFSEIELAYHQGLHAIPPTKPPGPPGAEAEEAFGRVAEASAELLFSQSKDFRAATYLTSALLRVGAGPMDDPVGARCFAGFRFGLELLHGLMESFWETMHPGVESRKASLTSLVSPDLIYPLLQVPLTSWGHGHSHFKEWITEAEPDRVPEESDTLWSGNFGEAFEETEREDYVRLVEELAGCQAALERLEETGRLKFDEAGENPPPFGDLKRALRDMASAAEQLLEKKPGPIPAEPDTPSQASAGETGSESQEPAAAEASTGEAEGEPPPVPGDGATAVAGEEPPPDTSAPVQPEVAAAPSAAPSPAPAELQNADQAAAAVASAARFLRGEDPRNPIPYLLLRSLRWGEVRGTDDRIDPLLLEAPQPEERRHLRSLFLDEAWQDLLEAAEEVMASEAGRGWLDLQRYAILASDHLGSDFTAVTAALRGALHSHLNDLPSLARATLMDDSAAASSDTLQWLEVAGFLAPQDEAEVGRAAQDDTDPDKIRRDASFARAGQMVQAGDPDGAIRLLMGRADRETSERASFVTRGEAARIMVERGETSVARPILEELLGAIDQHNLEEWESGGVVAKPLGLLLRCLDQGEGPLLQQIYERICRLDPLLARELRDSGHGE